MTARGIFIGMTLSMIAFGLSFVIDNFIGTAIILIILIWVAMHFVDKTFQEEENEIAERRAKRRQEDDDKLIHPEKYIRELPTCEQAFDEAINDAIIYYRIKAMREVPEKKRELERCFRFFDYLAKRYGKEKLSVVISEETLETKITLIARNPIPPCDELAALSEFAVGGPDIKGLSYANADTEKLEGGILLRTIYFVYPSIWE